VEEPNIIFERTFCIINIVPLIYNYYAYLVFK
jgi:hypothetical protein